MDTEDFANYMEQSINGLITEFDPGQKVKGIVTSIDKRSVFIDVNSPSEGIINREELMKDGELQVKLGDEVEAFFIDDSNGEMSFTVKMSGKIISSHLLEAKEGGIPVEGRVMEERKGGYTVKIADKDAFCPYSQISLYREDSSEFIGNTFSFLITELSDRNMVVSRRRILEQEKEKRREHLKETLKLGDHISGKVVRVMNFGAFVDLDGVDGFIPISEMSWGRVEKPEDILSQGDQVEVAVKDLNWDDNKITLSLRSAQAPWATIVAKYPIGKKCEATITRLAHFGAFAELETGIEGLIHISKLGAGKRINHPKEVIAVGDHVTVEVDRIDSENKRISLVNEVAGQAVEPAMESEPVPAIELEEDIEVEKGMTLKGKVDGIQPYGLFIKLARNKSGLLHISQIDSEGTSQNTFKTLSDKYPMGSEVTVVVQEIKDSKISLTLPETKQKADDLSNYKRDDSSSLGSLGDLFGGL